ncbi:hypothetical protein ACS0TY_005399 [Phlomoides rotata]
MESRSPLVLEISSDEEDGFGDYKKGSGFDVADGEDCDWLSKLLCEVSGNSDADSDDVVFVSEVFPKAPQKPRSESLKPSDKVLDVKSDDDDCVVLDCDPEKHLTVVNRIVEDDGDSDDLEIVGEKGEVACRDFPHPRHLCVKFPFASTPHEVHCGQCHCYACDSLAPCSKWGTGTSSINHCHASDKEEYWKTERKLVKKANKPVAEISTPIGTCRIESFFPPTQVPRPQPSSLVQHRGFNPVTIHPRPMSSNISVPRAINQVRNHPSGCALPRYKPQSHLGSQNPRSLPKRHDAVGASQINRHVCGSQLSGNPSLKRCRAIQTPVVNGCPSSNQQIIGSHTADSVIAQARLSSLHSMKVRRENYLPFQPGIHSRPYLRCLDQDPTQYQSQTPVQPYVKFSSSATLQPNISQPRVESINNLVFPQPHVFQPNNLVPPQAVASYQSDASNAFGNQLHSKSVISSYRVASSNLENHSSPTSELVNYQNDVQQGNQVQNGTDASSTDISFLLDSSLDNGNVQIHTQDSQYQSTEPAETSLFQNEPKRDHRLSIAPVESLSQQSVVLAGYTSPITDGHSHFLDSTGPDPLDFQFGTWMFENQPLSEAVDDSISPNWNVFSPEPSFIDTGTLFDI